MAPWSVPAIVHHGLLACPVPAEQRVAWMSWSSLAEYRVAALDRPAVAATKPVLAIGGAFGDHASEAIGRFCRWLTDPMRWPAQRNRQRV